MHGDSMLNGAIGPIMATASFVLDEHLKFSLSQERWLHVLHL